QLDELFARADFLSVGSNDLFQFLYAVDRSNRRVADPFDPLSGPVLRALKSLAGKGRACGQAVTLWGALAPEPRRALALVGLGYRLLSLTPSSIGPVKTMLLDLDARKVEALLGPMLESPVGSVGIRDRLESFAAAEGLQL